ncbi:BlaI/MecI/CopY family transcriptional regulator [Clostridiales bacterium COT073_COT-073]|nr:BlaI/MecI/CopY family transcriptional regulator [Clostridiales bacterium COT073_COT-073]
MDNTIKRLPDAEFTVMKAIWHSETPVTTLVINEHLSSDISWKPQTLLTILARLTEKGFLSSERRGRERCYTPLISENEYLEIETGNFLNRYSGNSIGHLVKALCADNDLSPEDLNELRKLLAEKGSV